MSRDSKPQRSGRRTFLKGAGALAVSSAIAGCSGNGSSGSGSSSSGSSGSSGSGSGGATTTQKLPTFENEAGVKVGETWEAVQELAKEEKAATGFATIDRGPWEEWMKAFNKQYPDVQIRQVTGGAEKLGSRWFTEWNTDNVKTNFYIGATGLARTWREGTTMELGGDIMPSFGDAPDKFKGDNNMWIGTRIVMGNIFINTDMASTDDYSSWMDVVTDQGLAGGKFGHDPTPNMVLMDWLYNNIGKEYFTSMRDLEPRWVDSHTDLARLCGAGEYPVCFTYTHKMGRFGGKMPLEHAMFDETPAQISPFVINNKAPQPNSAIVVANWLSSVEGQNKIGTTQYIPWHPDAKYSGYPGVYPPKNGEVSIIDPATKTETMQKRWKDIFGDQVSGGS